MNHKLLDRLLDAHQALLRGATEDAEHLVLSAIEILGKETETAVFERRKMDRRVPFFLEKQAE